VAVLAPKTHFDSVYADVAPYVRCHVLFLFYFFALGAKTATVVKLRVRFCSFFLKGTKIASSWKLGDENWY